MQGFIFGGSGKDGLPSTPEELQRRRSLAQAVMARNNSQQPKNIWEGLNSLATSVGERNSVDRLDKAEAEGTASGQAAYQPIIDAMKGGSAAGNDVIMGALNSPWLNEGQRSVAQSLLKQNLEANAPITPYQQAQLDQHGQITPYQQAQIDLDRKKFGFDVANSQKPAWGFFESNGDRYRFNQNDPNSKPELYFDGPEVAKDPIKVGEGDTLLDADTHQPVYQGPSKTTDDIREYNFYVAQAKAAGQTPLPFDQFQMNQKKAGATSINMNTGEPGDSKLRGKLQEKEGEAWSGYQQTASQTSGIMQQLDVLDELGKMAPQGGIQGRLAQTFKGFSTAGDAFMSIATRIAPSFRTPGSGSQSDIEYEGFLNGLPRLQTTPGGNRIISATLRAKGAIDMERGAVVDRYSNGDITAAEARRQMADLNKRSIMTPELQAVIGANTEKPQTGAPDADGWTTLPNGVRIREMK